MKTKQVNICKKSSARHILNSLQWSAFILCHSSQVPKLMAVFKSFPLTLTFLGVEDWEI